MDNRIANDMISSGMIPSGEKKKEDLSRIQYGSAPSPSKLMDAYKSMYEHHQKDKDGNTIPHEGEELNEGKIPAGLQAYLYKKKGKKEDKKEMKEGLATAAKMAFSAVKNMVTKKNIKKLAGDAARGAAMQAGSSMVGGMMSGGQQKPKTGTVSASADLFDIVKGQLLDEGLSEEEIRDIMLTLTPDEILNEISVGKMANYISAADKDVQKTAASIRKDGSVMGDDPRVKRMSNRGKGMAMAGDKIARKMTPSLMSLPRTEEYKNFDPKKPDPKQMAAQAKQEKNRQKFNDPMGVKNRNIGGQGLDPMDK